MIQHFKWQMFVLMKLTGVKIADFLCLGWNITRPYILGKKMFWVFYSKYLFNRYANEAFTKYNYLCHKLNNHNALMPVCFPRRQRSQIVLIAIFDCCKQSLKPLLLPPIHPGTWTNEAPVLSMPFILLRIVQFLV